MNSSKGVRCSTYSDCKQWICDRLESNRVSSTQFFSPKGTIFITSRTDNGVFIELNSDQFTDRLNEIMITTEIFECDGVLRKGSLIRTISHEKKSISVLSYMAVDLIECVDHGEVDLEEWSEKWRSTVGDTISHKTVYDVLGEMIVLAQLKKDGLEPEWAGPYGGRHDISCSTSEYEIKSTISSKMISEVTISSGRQLDPTPGKTLFLVPCMFEEKEYGAWSIDILYNKLLNLGFSKETLDESLMKLGVNTTPIRNRRFDLIANISLYEVNSDFPRLSSESFVGGHYPDHIVDVSYTISLSEDLASEELRLTI